MDSGLIALIIILAVITAAILTHRCVECLLFGSIVAAVIQYRLDFIAEWSNTLLEVVTDEIWVILVCGLFGGLISLLQKSKGTQGFTRLVSKYCNTERKTLLTTFFMGILIFVDDYLNVLTIGTCMKGVFDKEKSPREALAFLLDSTGAPVCVLLPFSTWAVFYADLFSEQESVQALGYSSSMEAYIHAIPFCIYPMVMLLIVFLFCMGWFPKLGTMKKAYERVATTGKVYSDESAKYNKDEEPVQTEQEGYIRDFLVPMLVMVIVAIVTSDLLVAVIVGIAVCFVMYIPTKRMKLEEFIPSIIEGINDMLPVLTMLMMAFMLQRMVSAMGMAEYIISLVEPFLTPVIYPAIVFLIVSGTAFVTGSDWGMCAIATPIVFPLGAMIGVNPLLTMAAVICGGTFGSHACFYADATLLASAGAGIDNMEHAFSQLPYAAIGAGVSVVGFLIFGMVA